MLRTKTAISPLGGLALAAAMQPVPARAQHDHAAHADITAPMPPPSPRWAADAALQDGMERIHTELEELRHYEMGHTDAAMALERVGMIEQAAADIFVKCKLTPEQDAVLHGMLMPLLSAAQKFKADPQDTAQVKVMRKAMADYPRYFNVNRSPTAAPPAAQASHTGAKDGMLRAPAGRPHESSRERDQRP